MAGDIGASSKWSVYLVDLEAEEMRAIRSGLSKREAVLLVQYFRVRKTGCVLIPWPEWVPFALKLQAA